MQHNAECEKIDFPFQKGASNEHALSIAFYSNILNKTAKAPQIDLQILCKAWMDSTGAEWVWLWLQHEGMQNSPWELTAVYGNSYDSENYVPNQPELVAITQPNCLAEYCSYLQQPIFIGEIGTWEHKLQFNGLLYRIVSREWLISHYCTAILAVPVMFPKDVDKPPITKESLPRSDSNAKEHHKYSLVGSIRGLITCHYTSGQPVNSLLNRELYLLMGYATSQAIASSFVAEQHRILLDLELLPTKFLGRNGSVIDGRTKYLADILTLLQKYLRVSFVSIFFESAYDKDRIECIATTGIRSATGELQRENELGSATYGKGEGKTGEVFASGVPFVCEIGQEVKRANGTGKGTWREIPNSLEETQVAWLCYPIVLRQSDSARQAEVRTIGVVRCVGNKSILSQHGIERNFDPIQVQTLDFICRQIASVLATMAIQIERERTIAIIKHDLMNPLNLIQSVTNVMASDYTKKQTLPHYCFSNVNAALILAKHLTKSLSDSASFAAHPTKFEGEILAMLVDGLRQFARIEGHMDISYENVRDVFPTYMNIDRDLIERAVVNLLVNAIKYGFADTTISITGEEIDSAFLLRVSNYGIGVDESETAKIFEGTYRSPKVRNVKQGLGLGLKIARAAMRQHGGDLILSRTSTPTEFTMIFPKRLATDIRSR